MNKQDRHKDKLADFIDKQFKSINKKVLDISEVVIPKDKWDIYRSKVLGATNDAKRSILDEVNKNYDIKFDPDTIYEDIIEVSGNTTVKAGQESYKTSIYAEVKANDE